MTPARGIYEATDVLVDWLSQNFEAVSEGVFRHYREAFNLLRIVDAAEKGQIPKFAAMSAIRDYNIDHHMSFTYEAIRDLESTFIFSDVNEWVLFTDKPFAVVCGEYDGIEQALSEAPETVKTLIVWSVDSDMAIVYRSPFLGFREEDGDSFTGDYSWGERKGSRETFVLPPEVEASLHSLKKGELLQQRG